MNFDKWMQSSDNHHDQDTLKYLFPLLPQEQKKEIYNIIVIV